MASGLKPGRQVRIEGMQKKVELNGKKGKIIRLEGERWVVKVSGMEEVSLSAANLVADEPERKRARFSTDEGIKGKGTMKDASSESEADEDGEEDDEDDEEDKAPPHSRWAEEVTTIRLIAGGAGAGVECEIGRFQPLYTHQVFYKARNKEDVDTEREHQELIIGYEDPDLEIVYAANSLKACVQWRNSAQVDIKLLREHSLTRTSVLDSVQTRVPMDYATKLSAVQTEAEAPFTPLGTLREHETLPDGSSLQIFHFTADTPETVKLVNRMQTFAVWLIETGQPIEVPDPKWNILTLYRVEKAADGRTVHTMLGFYTAYRYWAYDTEKKQLDNFRLRLSQCIILPPFQRQGHGARLLRAFYRFGRDDAHVLDMSVEDPSPEFQTMRDLTDMRQLQAEEGVVEALASACGRYELLAQLASRLKLCKPQIIRLSLLSKFVQLRLTDPAADPERAQIKELRLAVKQMLYKETIMLAKGCVVLDDEDEEDSKGSKHSAGQRAAAATTAAKRKKGADDDDDTPADLRKTAEAEMEKQMRHLQLWSNGGNAEERKAELRTMFAAKYREFSSLAAKLCG